MRDLEDEARIRAYMEAKMKHIKMYNECMNLADGLDVAKFAELVRADEREACAMMADEAVLQLNETANQLEDSEYLEGCAIQGAMTQAAKLSKAIRARGEK